MTPAVDGRPQELESAIKNLFLSSLIVVLGTSSAIAEVSFSGYGRFGLFYDEGNDDETRLDQRFRLNLDGRTETDGGVAFAARLRIQSDDKRGGSAGTAGFNAPRFTVAYSGLRLQVGNISGAFDDDETVFYSGYEPGLTEPIAQNSTFQGPIVEYDSTGKGVSGVSLLYKTDNFQIMGNYNGDHDGDTGSEFAKTYEIGAGYDFGPISLAAAYGNQDNGSDEVWYYVLNAFGSVGDLDYSLFFGDDDVGKKTSYGISGRYQVGAVTQIIASFAGGGADDLSEAFGVGVRHDLGAGVSLRGMVGQNEDGDTIADMGAHFNF